MGYGLVDMFEFRKYSLTCFAKAPILVAFCGIWHVPETETWIIWLSILGSKWGWQGRVHWGLPARRGNYSSEGVYLKKTGQRTLAKLKLNSVWSKWAQNQNKPPNNYCQFRERALRALNNSGYWGYKPHIPEQWSGMGLLEIFRE